MILNIGHLVDSFKGVNTNAIIHNGKKISYSEFHNDILKLCSCIDSRKAGSKKEVILVQSDHKYNLLLGLYATIVSGHIAAPVDSSLADKELNDIIQLTNSNLLITDKNTTRSEEIYVDLLDFSERHDTSHSSETILTFFPGTVALLLFSSGTSGRRKGVLLTQGNLIDTSRYINQFMEVEDPLVEYLMVPLHHSFGFARSRCVFMSKGTLIIDDGFFNPLLMKKRVQMTNCIGFSGVPATMNMFLNLTGKNIDDISEQIKYVEIGSAPMDKNRKISLLRQFPNANICMHYGLTEASRSCFINFRKEFGKIETVGMPSPGVTIRIANEAGEELPAGESGQITVKGPNVAAGYLNNPELTATKFRDGWHMTGDLGMQDEEGYVYFKGRMDDLINVGGEKVSPHEIEEKIKKLKILQKPFCLIGAIDKEGIYGEIPVLCVTEKEFGDKEFKLMLENLSRMSIKSVFLPRYFICMENLPLTHNGKIRRNHITIT